LRGAQRLQRLLPQDQSAACPGGSRAPIIISPCPGLCICEKAFGPDHPGVTGALEDLANLLRSQGDHWGARLLLERCLEIHESAIPFDEGNLAYALRILGGLLMDAGAPGEARPLFERALSILERIYGPDGIALSWPLERLATLLSESGEHDKALDFMERALANWEREGNLPSMLPDFLYGIAKIKAAMGDMADARALRDRALKTCERFHEARSPALARHLIRFADLSGEMGDDERVGSLYRRALAIQEEALGPDHPETARTARKLGEQLLRTGEVSDALKLGFRAEEAGRKQLSLLVSRLPERQALRFALARASGLDLILSIVVQDRAGASGAGGRAWDAVIRSRALVLDEMAARHRVTAEARRIARYADNLAKSSQRLANLMMRGPGQLPPEQYRNLLNEAQQEKEEAEKALADRSLSFRQSQSRAQLGLSEVAASLPKECALVSYVRYIRQPVAGEGSLPAEPKASYMAFVKSAAERQPAVVPLGDAGEIEALVSDWRKQAGEGWLSETGPPEDVETRYRAAGKALRQRVWDPVASHLEAAGPVFVVPDGVLHLVSLSVLPAGEGEYLVEKGPLVHYLSAERDLVPSGPGDIEGEGILVLGDPAFDKSPRSVAPDAPEKEGKGSTLTQLVALLPFRGKRAGCDDFAGLRFSKLPASAMEAEEITALWQRHGSGSGKETTVVSLQGGEADEATFKQDAPGKRVLHLATHGFFLGGECKSALEGGRGILDSRPGPAGGTPTHEFRLPALTGENPLLLSGLALAGANHRHQAGLDEEDGVLTAEEIASLDLSGVEWAVLSACDTGVGEVRAGEGVFGLRRAFEVAGVRSLIMSLWSVEDESAREWMKALYEAHLIQGKGTAESVRDASLAVLSDRRAKGLSTHPFYWGAFVAAGDWR